MLFNGLVNDWLRYFVNKVETTFPKDVDMSKHKNEHVLDYEKDDDVADPSANREKVYTGHVCLARESTSCNAIFTFAVDDDLILETFASPIEPLSILLTRPQRNVQCTEMWRWIFRTAMKSITGVSIAQIVDSHINNFDYNLLFNTITITGLRASYLFKTPAQLLAPQKPLTDVVMKSAAAFAHAASSYDFLDFVLNAYTLGYLGPVDKVVDSEVPRWLSWFACPSRHGPQRP